MYDGVVICSVTSCSDLFTAIRFYNIFIDNNFPTTLDKNTESVPILNTKFVSLI